MPLHVDAHSPITIRRQLTEQLTHVIEGGGVPPARPGIRELAGSLGSDPNTVARAIEDLKRSGYRPLRSLPGGPEPSSIPGGAHRHGAPRVRRRRGREAGEP